MRSGRSFISFRKPFGIFIVSNFETELARVAHRYTLEVEGIKRNMTWARIFNPRTVQFSKISPEKRRCQDLSRAETGTIGKFIKNTLRFRRRKHDSRTSLDAGRRARRK